MDYVRSVANPLFLSFNDAFVPIKYLFVGFLKNDSNTPLYRFIPALLTFGQGHQILLLELRYFSRFHRVFFMVQIPAGDRIRTAGVRLYC